MIFLSSTFVPFFSFGTTAVAGAAEKLTNPEKMEEF